MDRLDSWLHRQVGWRRAAVVWVMVCPLAVGLGWDLSLGRALVEVAALSVLAAVPFAFMAAAAQLRWQARNPGKPYPSWRMCVAMWCLAGSLLISMLTSSGHRSPGVVWLVQLALFAGAVVFWLLAVRQWSAVRRNGRSGPSVSASPHRQDGR